MRLNSGQVPPDSVKILREKVAWAGKVLNVLEKAKPVHNPMLADNLLAQVVEALSPGSGS